MKRRVLHSIANCTGFYAFLKIHKLTVAFSLIVSNICIAAYYYVHFLSQSLSNLTPNNLYTDKLKCISLSNYTMFSLIVTTFFANIPIKGALHYLEKKSFMNFFTLLLKLEKMGFINLCVRQTILVFNDVFYSPIEVFASDLYILF